MRFVPETALWLLHMLRLDSATWRSTGLLTLHNTCVRKSPKCTKTRGTKPRECWAQGTDTNAEQNPSALHCNLAHGAHDFTVIIQKGHKQYRQRRDVWIQLKTAQSFCLRGKQFLLHKHPTAKKHLPHSELQANFCAYARYPFSAWWVSGLSGGRDIESKPA